MEADNVKRILFLSLILILTASAAALAQQRDADIVWGNDQGGSGHWGIVYKKPLDDPHGSMETVFKIIASGNNQRYNRSVTGPYYPGGTSVTTVIGARLGVQYSPFTAHFHNNSQILGIRIYPIKVGPFNVDVTYVLGAHSGNTFFGPVIPGDEITKRDFIIGATGQIGNANLRAALLRRESGGNFYYNYSILLENSQLIPDVIFNAVYAAWGENNDWLYQVTAEWTVRPGVLLLRAGYRDSQIVNPNSNAVRGNVDGTAQERRYIQDSAFNNSIMAIYNRNNAYNIGVTTWFDFNDISNRLDVDFTNTNPNRRDDFDDQLSGRLQSEYRGFIIDQQLAALFPDSATSPTIRQHSYFDPTKPRLDYRLAVTSPAYDLPYDIRATVLFNYDWDRNYRSQPRTHTVLGVRLETTRNIYVFPNVQLGLIVMYDLPGVHTPAVLENPIKFHLRAAYNAPNGVKFRIDYLSSKDYARGDTSVHDEAIWQRYDRYTFHGLGHLRERFDGLRIVIAIPT